MSLDETKQGISPVLNNSVMKYIYLVTSCSDDINNIYEIFRADFGQYNFKRVHTFHHDAYDWDFNPNLPIDEFCLMDSRFDIDSFKIIHL